MSYSNNPLLPKARRQAVKLVLKEGFSVTTAAKKSGIHRSTLHRWLVKAQDLHKVPVSIHGLPGLRAAPGSWRKRLSAAYLSLESNTGVAARLFMPYCFGKGRLSNSSVRPAS